MFSTRDQSSELVVDIFVMFVKLDAFSIVSYMDLVMS